MIVIDTHIVLWLTSEPEKLSKRAKDAVDEARQNGEGIAISVFTLLELTILYSLRRIRLAMSIESFLYELERKFVVLPINAAVCARMLTLPANYPKDRADRVIGATTLVEGMALVTADTEIRRAKVVRTVW